MSAMGLKPVFDRTMLRTTIHPTIAPKALLNDFQVARSWTTGDALRGDGLLNDYFLRLRGVAEGTPVALAPNVRRWVRAMPAEL